MKKRKQFRSNRKWKDCEDEYEICIMKGTSWLIMFKRTSPACEQLSQGVRETEGLKAPPLKKLTNRWQQEVIKYQSHSLKSKRHRSVDKRICSPFEMLKTTFERFFKEKAILIQKTRGRTNP